MPASFDIRSSTGTCTVRIGAGLMPLLLAEPGERVYISDALFSSTLLRAGINPIVIEANEHSKSLDRMTAIIESMKDGGATRTTTLVAIGGGVVQDIATFVASVYMRGVTWIYAPTTLLSMTDSCIGGKSSINVGRYKNIVGTFRPPARVVIDPELIGTLSVEQRIAGLSESVKICLCRGPATLDRYFALGPSAQGDDGTLAAVIELCLRSKQWFVETDEFDRNERLKLNFRSHLRPRDRERQSIRH